ncbi:hypothetical protein JOB18_040405 [Solea senegalensis]|uniref:Uncharacterized protein n=1 Tax=Solea senegalensis TaxID=28829 RepID=A0AAV6RKV1_SOLSE|nr:hypothetical protein JOB18_040405 [Solea senegalensis]
MDMWSKGGQRACAGPLTVAWHDTGRRFEALQPARTLSEIDVTFQMMSESHGSLPIFRCNHGAGGAEALDINFSCSTSGV